jgi:CheY-like chemotaxis protein
MEGMHRPCFLVIDREYPGSISTRKLVIETAKFNVLTAYSGREALDLVERFPAVDGVVLDSSIEDVPCSEIVSRIKAQQPRLPVIVIHTAAAAGCEGADFDLLSFNPAALLEILTGLNPRDTDDVGHANRDAEIEQNVRKRVRPRSFPRCRAACAQSSTG